MATETPIFDSLVLDTLRAHDEELRKAEDLGDDALPDWAYDHALYAFEGVHPHYLLEASWREEAQREFADWFGV